MNQSSAFVRVTRNVSKWEAKIRDVSVVFRYLCGREAKKISSKKIKVPTFLKFGTTFPLTEAF